MGLAALEAMLWRRVNKATFDSLAGASPGQYDIRLTASPDIAVFFVGLPTRDATELGGDSIDLTIEPFDGLDPVPRQELEIRYMGARSARKDWNIPSQRPETAYPLWRLGSRAAYTFDATRRDFVLILRDRGDNFHARSVTEETFAHLPETVSTLLLSKEVGVCRWTL